MRLTQRKGLGQGPFELKSTAALFCFSWSSQWGSLMSVPACSQMWFYPSSWANLKDVRSRNKVYLGSCSFSLPGILLFLILVTDSFFPLGTLFRLVYLKPTLSHTWVGIWPWLGQLKFIFVWSQRLVQEKYVTQAGALKALARTFPRELFSE